MFALFALVIASFPSINIYNGSSISKSDVEKIYSAAQSIFLKHTYCVAPNNESLAIVEKSIEEINKKFGSMLDIEEGYSIVGIYDGNLNIIYIGSDWKNKKATLMHEMFHFLFYKSRNCNHINNTILQHIIIGNFFEMERPLITEHL